MVEELFSSLIFSVFGLVFLGVGLHTANTGRKERAQSKQIAQTETTEIRNLQPGTAEIKGTAHPAEGATTVQSPITGTEALAARVEVEEWESSGEGGGSWETKHETQTAVPIVVDDGTDEVRVELPAAGEFDLEQTRTEVGSGDEPPTEIKQYLESTPEIDEATRHDIGPLSIGERRRYSEGVIEPGEEVYVLGGAREEEAGWGERAYAVDEPAESGHFILSDKSEETLIREGNRTGIFYLGFGSLFAVIGTGLLVVPWVPL
jgi:hypothetical protein